MPFNADAITLTLIALLAVLVIGIAVHAFGSRNGARRRSREAAAVSAAIIDYFRRSGVQVAADCFSQNGARRYIAMVESEPMKRFRLSHIIEMTVREHVRKTCGVELDKIYWRFPIKDAAQASQQEPEKKAGEASDDYINEGLEHYRHIPKPEVTEVPWESFEQVTGTGRHKNSDPPSS